jgi:hypothetical protein
MKHSTRRSCAKPRGRPFETDNRFDRELAARDKLALPFVKTGEQPAIPNQADSNIEDTPKYLKNREDLLGFGRCGAVSHLDRSGEE